LRVNNDFADNTGIIEVPVDQLITQYHHSNVIERVSALTVLESIGDHISISIKPR